VEENLVNEKEISIWIYMYKNNFNIYFDKYKYSEYEAIDVIKIPIKDYQTVNEIVDEMDKAYE